MGIFRDVKILLANPLIIRIFLFIILLPDIFIFNNICVIKLSQLRDQKNRTRSSVH